MLKREGTCKEDKRQRIDGRRIREGERTEEG